MFSYDLKTELGKRFNYAERVIQMIHLACFEGGDEHGKKHMTSEDEPITLELTTL